MRNIGKQSSKRPRRDRKPLDQYWRRAEELAEDQNRRVFLGYASPKCIRCPIPALICREWSEGLLSSRDGRLLASADGLANLEALELGMAEVEGLVLSGPVVSGSKGLGSGPGVERGPGSPIRTRLHKQFQRLVLTNIRITAH